MAISCSEERKERSRCTVERLGWGLRHCHAPPRAALHSTPGQGALTCAGTSPRLSPGYRWPSTMRWRGSSSQLSTWRKPACVSGEESKHTQHACHGQPAGSTPADDGALRKGSMAEVGPGFMCCRGIAQLSSADCTDATPSRRPATAPAAQSSPPACFLPGGIHSTRPSTALWPS